MLTLLDLFSENDQIEKWHQNLTDKKRQLMLGLSTSTKALAIASSLRQEDKIVLLTSTYGEAEGLVSDLISVLGEELVYPFLVDDSPMVEFLMSSQEKIISRVEALRFLTDSSISDNHQRILGYLFQYSQKQSMSCHNTKIKTS